MKILIVRTHASILSTTSYNVQEVGLAKAYNRLGHQTNIVMYGGKEKTHTVKVPCDSGEISVYYMKAYNFLKNGIFPGLKKFAMDYDIIQVHEYDQITSWMLYTDKKLKNRVIIYHGPYYSDFNQGYNLKCWLFDHSLLKLRSNMNCTCFTKSEAAVDFLREKGFRHVVSVGVGLDTDVWKDLCESSCKESGEKDKIDLFNYIYIGKLEPRRNTLFLLDVVDKMLSKHEDVSFTIIGDGEANYKAKCLEKAKRWLDTGRIKYISKVNQCDMPSIYANADCMLFPSIYEIFGMVLMEAMYFGVPVITSNNGGADMLFHDGENGILIDSAEGFELDEWVAAAEKMYSDSDLREKIKAQLERDRHRLSWDTVAKKISNEISW